MNPAEHRPRLEDSFLTRREFLHRSGMGFGALSLASLLGPEMLADGRAPAAFPAPAERRRRSRRRRSTSSIFSARALLRTSILGIRSRRSPARPGQELPGLRGKAFASPFKFNKQGKSGIEVSEVFPKLGEHVDEMAIIRSMYTDIPAHEVAQVFMNTGSLRLPRPEPRLVGHLRSRLGESEYAGLHRAAAGRRRSLR